MTVVSERDPEWSAEPPIRLSRSRLSLAALLLATLALAYAGPALARIVFILGSALVGYIAWREAAGRSVEVAIVLYSVAPFLRRFVDAGAGFDPSGVMLLGPVLAITIPTVELRDLLVSRRKGDEDLLPFLLIGGCVTYGMLLSAFSGAFIQLSTVALKTYVPLFYGAWLLRQARVDSSIKTATINTFFVITPIIAVYGILQYINPPDWDRYWMRNVSGTISVLGEPEPFKVRVFSTMNSPASFGTYAAFGMLMFGFCRRGWLSLLLAIPVLLGLLLSLYRTAWLSLIAGIAFCALFGRTRSRAGLIVVAILLAAFIAASTTEMGDVVMQRIESLTGSAADDGSGRARLEQLAVLYEHIDELVIGWGFSSLATPIAGYAAADGEIVTAAVTMGIVVGGFYIAGLIWAAMQALWRINGSSDPVLIVLGACIIGMLVGIPLTAVTSGEMGLLFWLFIATATSDQHTKEHQIT